MKPYTWSKLFLSALVVLSTSLSWAAGLRCVDVLADPRQSLTQYKAASRERAQGVIEAKFTNPQREMIAAKTWKGVEGPELLQALLPEGVSFIDHALFQANEEGLVKTATGSMVHLRAKIGETGTNIGVNINALKSNFNRDVKSLVRENADAVILFIHGGGTKTTGHHVAASLMSWMNVRNVDVVAMDMPWHGEGARVSFDSVKASLEHMRDYVKKYISPAGKPVILVGHSMGGVVADLYMRMYPNDKLISGVAPLSTVADALPGGTISDKLNLEAAIAEKNKTNPNIPEAERVLGDSLARQNKLSPTCGMFCQILISGIDWMKPAHKGEEYLPALYVIGDGDGLYQGYEKSFKEGVGALPKAQLKIFDQRRDIKEKDGKFMTVGHLIFDHRPRIDFTADLPKSTQQEILNGTIKEAEFNRLRAEGKIVMSADFKHEDIADAETFVLLKNFIGQVIGKPLTRIKTESAPLDLVMQAYANNLAFREFVRTYVFQNMKATEKSTALGQELGRLQQEIRKIGQARKDQGKLTEEQQNELDSLNERFKATSAVLAQKGFVKPENQAHYSELQAELQNLNSNWVPRLSNERKDLRTSLAENKSVIARAEKFLAEHEKSLSSPQLANLRNAKERAFKLMMDQDAKVRDLTNAYLFASHSNGRFAPKLFENIPAQTIAEFEKFDKAAQLYQRILRQYESKLLQAAANGQLNGAVAVEAQQMAQAALTAKTEMQFVADRIEKIDIELTAYANKTFQIEKQLAQLSGIEYFVPEYHTIEKILSQSLQSARENKAEISNLLQKIWADWQKIWSVRVSESSESSD